MTKTNTPSLTDEMTQFLKTEEQQKPRFVVFVCTGNTCRSPMAAALFNFLQKSEFLQKFEKSGDRRFAVSAGIAASGSPISQNAVLALEDRGVPSTSDNNYRSHVSRMITEELMASADAVIGISGSHAMALMGAFPQYTSKIFAMPRDISDPFGGDVEDYIRCLSDIEAGLREAFFHE